MAAIRSAGVDVAIIGGGPAGAAAALALLRFTRHRILVVEGTNYKEPRIGETVSAAVLPLLDYLGARSCISARNSIEAFSNDAAWGSPAVAVRDFIFSGRGSGWHLDRRQFDAALARKVRSRGGKVLQGVWLRAANFHNDHWELHFKGAGRATEIVASQIIDATGRRAAFARHAGAHRQVYDRLVGVAAYFKVQNGADPRHSTLVESVRDGWWYSAPLPRSHLVTVFMTSIERLRQLRTGDPDTFQSLVRQTQHIAARVGCGTLLGKPRVYPAESQKLVPCVGPRWVAAGDAAVSFDPLSSLGIGYALASGIQAARIANQLLAGREYLASFYPQDIGRHFATYLAQRQRLYEMERRWPDAPFWAERHVPAEPLLRGRL